MNEVELEHRLTVIEESTKRIEAHTMTISANVGDLSRHVREQNHRIEKAEADIAVLETRPPGYISKPQADELLREHADLWSVWRFSRWFIPISIPISVAIVELLNHVGFFEALFKGV